MQFSARRHAKTTEPQLTTALTLTPADPPNTHPRPRGHANSHAHDSQLHSTHITSMSAPRALRALARPARLSTTFTPSIRAATPARAFSQTIARKGGDSHHYDAPTGWLFGVKPGEEYKKEGWENATFYVMIPMMVLFVGVYAFKPDTRYVCSGSARQTRSWRGKWRRCNDCGMRMEGRLGGCRGGRKGNQRARLTVCSIQTWALEEARRRLEAEGILPDPDVKKD